MYRQGFWLLIRIMLLCCFVLSVTGTANAAGPSPVSFDGSHTWFVRPLNKTPHDAANLQQAINSARPGDRIELAAGVFNFGDFDSVYVPKDLTIEGAWDDMHSVPLTVIQGGFAPLTIGRKTPQQFSFPKMTVNGHAVEHITKEPMGQLYFPFLYPPYFDQGTLTALQPYVMSDHWAKVYVTVRQITFQRPYYLAIFSSGMRGGVIERCRFISAWPIQSDYWGGGWTSMAVQWWNLQGSMSWAASNFTLPPFTDGEDFVSGNIILRDNYFEGDYGEALEGARDLSGRVVFVPFDGQSAPPENDYDNYVVQDLYTSPSMWYMNPTETPALFWVRKGYEVYWQSVNGQMQVVAVRGQGFGMHTFGGQQTMTVKNNFFHNDLTAVNFPSPEGQFGVPFNAIVTGNSITTNIHSIFDLWGAEGVLVADWYGGSPGSNATVKDNHINISITKEGNANFTWNNSAIDIEIQGKTTITGNTVKMNSENAIALWTPTQNGIVQDNQISGKGDYAFASFYSNGDQFIDNVVNHFTPTGLGLYDLGWDWGWPEVPVPAARGILYSSDSNVVQGIGKPGPLDVVYDCGQNNQIKNMIRMACPASSASLGSAGSRSARSPLHLPMRKNPMLPMK